MKWIDVKEKLPNEEINPVTRDFQEVLCFCNFGGVPKASDIRVYKFGRGHFLHGPQIMDAFVTHWMPFPKPPKIND